MLLLVAVTGAIAAAAMEGLRLSRDDRGQRHRARSGPPLRRRRRAARLAHHRRPHRRRARSGPTLAGGWNGATRRVALPGGGIAEVRVRDGGNCFNVNSVADGQPGERLTRRPSGVLQFTGLMMALEVPQQDARRIAEAAADWVDSDALPGPGGAEDEAYAAGAAPYRTGNTLFADPGELRALAGMTPEIYARLRPWLCALPITDLSPININTLGLDQAPLLAMLAPGQLDVPRARRVLAQRPSNGWANQVEFWRLEAMSEVNVPLDVQLQPQLKTNWFTLDVRVQLMGAEFGETVLVDARLQPSRIVARRWGE